MDRRQARGQRRLDDADAPAGITIASNTYGGDAMRLGCWWFLRELWDAVWEILIVIVDEDSS